MPTSTITSKGQTTVPKEVRDILNVDAGDKLTWEIKGGRVAVTTERPALYRWKGVIKRPRRCGEGRRRGAEDQRTHLTCAASSSIQMARQMPHRDFRPCGVGGDSASWPLLVVPHVVEDEVEAAPRSPQELLS